MHKPIIAFILFSVFTTTVVAPTVIMMVDDCYDVSMFYNITEEEKKEKEADGKKEMLFSIFLGSDLQYVFHLKRLEHSYLFGSYNTPHLNLVLPPPEFLTS